MNDKDCSGKVSVEEVMQILFLRYGRQLLDSVRPRHHSVPPACAHLCAAPPPPQQLEEIFGTSDTNSGTRDLSLTEFLVSLNTSASKQRARAEARTVRPPLMKKR